MKKTEIIKFLETRRFTHFISVGELLEVVDYLQADLVKHLSVGKIKEAKNASKVRFIKDSKSFLQGWRFARNNLQKQKNSLNVFKGEEDYEKQ